MRTGQTLDLQRFPISKIRFHLPDAHVLRAAGWSLSGNVVPMLAAVAAVPYLLKTLGADRMGVLSLVWVFVGYFNFLDLGLGRAVTVAVVRARGKSDAESPEELDILGTAATLLLGLGVLAAVALALCMAVWGVPVATGSTLPVAEVHLALLWTLPSLPLLLLATVLRGHLEAVGAFRALNVVRIPTGILLVLGPCIAAWLSSDLVGVCISILLVRLLHAMALSFVSAHLMRIPMLRFGLVLLRSWRWKWLTSLLSFGAWVTVSNVLGPIIVYADRFVLGATLAASAVTLYAIPFDVISRLPVLTASLAAVLLPALVRRSAGSGTGQDPRTLLQGAYRLSLLLLGPALGVGWLAMPWLLGLWIDASFAQQASEAARILLLAFTVNALSQIPFAAMQAAGRVRALALLHTAELIPYLALLWFAVAAGGVTGAAYACLLRSCVDFVALLGMYHGASAYRKSTVVA